MSDTEWLQNLKAGDTVIVEDRHGGRVGVVERFTATMIVLKGGSRWRREDGRNVGGSVWDSASLEHGTPERVAAVLERQQHKRRINQLRGANWSALPAELVKQVHAIVFPEEPGK